MSSKTNTVNMANQSAALPVLCVGRHCGSAAGFRLCTQVIPTGNHGPCRSSGEVDNHKKQNQGTFYRCQ
jgi:hypothetical protein